MRSQEPAQPVIGFPLALALLLICFCFMAGFCLCCLHWNRLRALLGLSSHTQLEVLHKCLPSHQDLEAQKKSLPVLMPGDEVPKFIAIPCPCQPPNVDKLSAKVQKPLV